MPVPEQESLEAENKRLRRELALITEERDIIKNDRLLCAAPEEVGVAERQAFITEHRGVLDHGDVPGVRHHC
jgi:hypothetical protein